MKQFFLHILLPLALIATTVEVGLQFSSSNSKEWSDRPLLKVSKNDQTPISSLSTSETAEFRIALVEAAAPKYTAPPDSRYPAILQRILYQPDQETSVVVRQYPFHLEVNHTTATELSRWHPNVMVLVVDDYWLFEAMGVAAPSNAPPNRVQISQVIRNLSEYSESLQRYKSLIVSPNNQKKWKNAFHDMAIRMPNANRVLMILPALSPPYLKKEAFRRHHRILGSLARRYSFSLLNLSKRLLPLSSLRATSHSPQYDDIGELGHRLAGESLYRAIYASGFLPTKLRLPKIFRTRTDIRLLDNNRIELSPKDTG